jgi:hypothetical protein
MSLLTLGSERVEYFVLSAELDVMLGFCAVVIKLQVF